MDALRARRALRLDAACCAAAGVLTVVVSRRLARLFDVPTGRAAAIGAVVVVWAGVLVVLARRDAWRGSLTFVALANVGATLGVLVLALLASDPAAKMLLVLVAIAVAAFALLQVRILVSAGP